MKKITMLLIAGLIITTGIINISCSCSSCSKQEQASVPLDVLNKSNEFIIGKTGEEFFNKYITPDFVRTKYTPPYYEMAYRFFMPEKDYVVATIKFTVDSAGNVLKDREIIGIPDCKNNPSDCNFNIDKENAIQIARESGLKAGIKDWDVGFIWNPQLQKYVWHVLSTLQESEGELGYRGSGQEAIINPVTGELIEIHDWHVR